MCSWGLWVGTFSSFGGKSHSGKGTKCNFKLRPRKERGLTFAVFAGSGSWGEIPRDRTQDSTC